MTRRPDWAKQVAKVRAQLDRWEVPVILGVRFLPGVATAGLIAVALSSISATRFLLLNAVAAVIWAMTFGLLGYLLGNSVEWLLGEVERYERPIALALLAITVVWIGYHQWRRWGRRRPSRRAAARGPPDLIWPYQPSGADPSPMASRGSRPAAPRRGAISGSSTRSRSASAADLRDYRLRGDGRCLGQRR